MNSYLTIDQCKPNYLYFIKARNSYLGVFVPEQDNGFLIVREKFGSTFPFVEYHWDNGPPYGTVKPLEEICEFPLDVQHLGYDLQEFIRLTRLHGQPTVELRLEQRRAEAREAGQYREAVKNPITRRQLLDNENTQRQAVNDEYSQLHLDMPFYALKQNRIQPLKTMKEFEDELIAQGYEIIREET